MSGHYMRQYREQGEGIELSAPTPAAVAKANHIAERLKGKSEYVRGFHITAEAWYGKSPSSTPDKPEVLFGSYAVAGGTNGEMSVKWHTLRGKLVPRLDVFDDAWSVLYSFADVLELMAEEDNCNIPPKEFTELLLRCGFKDLTAYKRKESE